MPTWREVIVASGLPRLEAQLLIAHATGRKRSWLIAHEADQATDEELADARALFARRADGEPMAYILGSREFFGLEFVVTPAVLIPRPETELLVEMASARLPQGGALLDVGTGSGAVAITVAHLRPDASVCASDISPAAIGIARGNAARVGVAVEIVHSDLFSALSGRRFDVIASNPPYVAPGDPHLSQGDLRFEPRIALESPGSGLAIIQRLADAARDHLAPGGTLVFEHGHDQGPDCVELLQALGYRDVTDYNDLAGQSRVARGQWRMA